MFKFAQLFFFVHEVLTDCYLTYSGLAYVEEQKIQRHTNTQI